MKAPDHNEMYYFKFTILSLAYFFAFSLAIHLIANRRTRVYSEMTPVKQTLYRSYILSIAHAIGCVILSTISMFYICSDGKTVFNSDECINTPRYIHIWALLHTCGYFLMDFFFMFFIVQGNTALDYQTYAHHLVATATFYQTLYFMDFMVVFGVMLLFIEVSTIFVSFRWLLFTHGHGDSQLYKVNALISFVMFLLGRVVFQFYIVFFIGLDWVYWEYERKNLTFYKALVVTEMAIMVILSIVLNSYWFILMLKMLIRTIKKLMGGNKQEDEEKVELVKADALAEEADCGSSTQGSNLDGGEIVEENQQRNNNQVRE